MNSFGSLALQELHYRSMTSGGSQTESCIPLIIFGVYICPLSHQHFSYFLVALKSRYNQRCGAIPIFFSIHVSSLF